MKLLVLVPSLQTGGAEKLIIDSLNCYEERGVEVELLVLLDKQTIFSELLKDRGKIKTTFLSKGSVYSPMHIFRLVPYFKNFDLVHVHLFPTLYWSVLAKYFFLLKTPLIFTEHSTSNNRRGNNLFKIIDRFIYSKLSFIGCISAQTKSNLEEHLGNNTVSKGLISNGINLNYFKKNVSRHSFSFLKVEDFVLIQVSSFRYPKDQKTIIRSLVELPEQVKLVLVGDGLLREECELLVDKLNLDNRVFFLGNRIDISDLINASDIFVLSSAYEGVPVSIIEAMACSKPVIGSNVVGISEVVNDVGLLFEYGNEYDLTEKILEIFSDEKVYNDFSDKSLMKSKEFDIGIMVDKYIEVYKEIVDGD